MCASVALHKNMPSDDIQVHECNDASMCTSAYECVGQHESIIFMYLLCVTEYCVGKETKITESHT